ncbi:unknown protein [Seminavis robusta]|uniref:Uncharacterized protein n=1 Tax=Seminavis robusta TaxID=568900 RepID=A0A9N8EW63_9STRA|nr:unknown protein [Seminavis robusta]|eukprot:Sro2096_g314250.1 n/a (239) ;mRNA; f:504-1220
MAKFVQHNPDALDLETFQALTRLEITPLIEANAALTLCVLEDKAAKDSTKELSKLQERCSDSLAQNWQSLVSPSDTTVRLLQDRQPTFLVDLLLKSLKDANTKLASSQASLSSTQQQLSTTKSTLQSTLQSNWSSLWSVRQELSSAQDALSTKTKELQEMTAELHKFKPLKNRSTGRWKDAALVPGSLSRLNPSLETEKMCQYDTNPPYQGSLRHSRLRDQLLGTRDSDVHYVFVYKG